MFFKKKKKEKMKIQDFYPKKEMFRYINYDFYKEDNHSTIIAQLFSKEIGYYPNIEHPQTFNEKILWLNKYYHNPLLTLCADKYLVKDYIKEQLGEDLCIPILKKYNSIYDINLDELPNQFVLKVNWGRGKDQVIIVKDKRDVTLDKIRLQINDWLQPWNNFYFANYAWEYKNMKPIIYAEKYVEEIDRQLNNYKIYCFNGKAKMTAVADNRFAKNKVTKTFFDNDWNILPIKKSPNSIHKRLAKPKSWEQMFNIAEKLAEPFPLACVGFYIIDNKPYIKNITFHIERGFEAFTSKEWDEILGADLQLPEKWL